MLGFIFGKTKLEPTSKLKRYMDASELLERYATGERYFVGVDLHGVDLSSANLAGIVLNHTYLVGINLSNANLYGASLVGVEMESGDLSNANLCGASLSGDLYDLNLSQADLCGANLESANLLYAKLDKANLENTKLRGAELETASLSDANLKYADLSFANLERAILDNAILNHANLYAANLSRGFLDCASFNLANLYTACLENVSAENADFSNANLIETNFCGANLRKARFRRSNLAYANLYKSSLYLTDFSDANLSGTLLYRNERGIVKIDRDILKQIDSYLKSQTDWNSSLQSLQVDFLQRLNYNCLLHCEVEGQHSELTVISGKRLEQLNDFCWTMADKYKKNSSVREVFENNMKGKLGEEVIKLRLAELVTEIDYEKRLGGDGKVDFRLTYNPSIGIQVKTRYGNHEKTKWEVSSGEIKENAVLVFILSQEEFNTRKAEYQFILAGFLPTSMIQTINDKASVGISELLYGGALKGYLQSLHSI